MRKNLNFRLLLERTHQCLSTIFGRRLIAKYDIDIAINQGMKRIGINQMRKAIDDGLGH